MFRNQKKTKKMEKTTAIGARPKEPINQPTVTTRSRSASLGRQQGHLYDNTTDNDVATVDQPPTTQLITGNAIEEGQGAVGYTLPPSQESVPLLYPIFHAQPQRNHQRDHRSTSQHSSNGEDQETNPRRRSNSPQQHHTLSDDPATSIQYSRLRPKIDSRPLIYDNEHDTNNEQQRVTSHFRRSTLNNQQHFNTQQQPQVTSHLHNPTNQQRTSVTSISDKLSYSLEPTSRATSPRQRRKNGSNNSNYTWISSKCNKMKPYGYSN